MKLDLYAVIGDPIAHSLSPAMQNAAFRAAGLNARCEAVRISPDQLEEGVEDLVRGGLRGFNVTIPHKVAVMRLMNYVDPIAQRVGAINTVAVREGGAMHGYNTDVYGLTVVIRQAMTGKGGTMDIPDVAVGTAAPVPVLPLHGPDMGMYHEMVRGSAGASAEGDGEDHAPPGLPGGVTGEDRDRSRSPYGHDCQEGNSADGRGGGCREGGAGAGTAGAGPYGGFTGRDIIDGRRFRAVVFGAGGSAQAAVHALDALDAEVAIVSRDRARAERLAHRVSGAAPLQYEDDALADALIQADLVVNTTPLGMKAHADLSPLPGGAQLRAGSVAIDLVYGQETPFLRAAQAQGCLAIDGIEMLVQQGARSFQIWTGIAPDIDCMRAACRASLQGVV